MAAIHYCKFVFDQKLTAWKVNGFRKWILVHFDTPTARRSSLTSNSGKNNMTLLHFGSFSHGFILKDKTIAETSPKCSEFSSKLQQRRKIQSRRIKHLRKPDTIVAEINSCLLKSSFLSAAIFIHLLPVAYIYIYMNGALHFRNL